VSPFSFVLQPDLDVPCPTLPSACSEELLGYKRLSQQHLDSHYTTLHDLEELGDIMSEILEQQQRTEVCPSSPISSLRVISNFKRQMDCTERLSGLHQHLLTLEDLTHHFTAYRLSFNRLLVEIARRRHYKEAAENIVHGMIVQLQAMTEGKHSYV